MKNNPYVGPRPFGQQEHDQKNFYGRDREARDLFSLILAERVVLFYAQSGAGKTSLLNARVIPALERRGFEVLPVTRVANDPPPEIARRDVQNMFAFSVLMGLAEGDPAELLGHTLLSYLQQTDSDVEEGQPPILILDQFEEVFTAHRDRWQDTQGFFEQLGDALKGIPTLGIILAMREDYVAGVDPYASYFPKGFQARFRMERLGVAGALEAVREPATRAGRPFAPGVAEWLVDNLRRVKVPVYEQDLRAEGETGSSLGTTSGVGLSGFLEGGRDEPGSVLGPHVEAVQLQVVCRRMWENLAEDEQVEIKGQDVGDVDQALTEFYESVVRAAVEETGVREREVRRWFDKKLITPLGTRNLVLRGGEETGGLPNEAVDVLRARHLISADVRAGGRWYELSHDRLIEPVRESNVTWRRNNLQPFQRQATRWEDEGRPTSLLLGTEALREAERWVATHPDDLVDLERVFLDASREARSRAEERELAMQAELRTNLADMGWGVIFAAQDGRADAVREALSELLEHRREQATRKQLEYYKEFTRSMGYRPGETATQFLARHGVGASVASPDKMPYYLLIVGDPELIPYEFQYGLDVQYAVGRIHFETLQEYAQYARSVVTAESDAFSSPQRAVIFGPQNPESQAMAVVMDHLTRPVVERLTETRLEGDWLVQEVLKEAATKERLGQLLGGAETPTLLFTVSYGLGLSDGHARQIPEQGALLCQEWPGRDPDEAHERIPADYYFSSGDVADDARLLGLVAFLLTNYSAGTPRMDDFAHQSFQEPQPIAPHAFVARLPQRLLGHPKGGALAVIGHVERAWTGAFLSHGGLVSEFGVFENTIRRLIKGHTVGSAMELFNHRYTQLSASLGDELQQVVFRDQERDDLKLAGMMTQTIDARNYVVIGDPAVRLPVRRGVEVAERPTIEPVTLELEALDAGKGLELAAEPALSGEDSLVFNGISGASGEYLLPPMTFSQMSAIIQRQPQEAETGELRVWYQRVLKAQL